MPMLVTDIMNRLLEILQLFNRKTYQLVLEAGAFQTIGLKSITAKHLAVASQSLLAVAAVVPIVRGYFDSRLQQREKVLLNHFDFLSQAFSSHSQEIHSKLISMIDEVISRQLSKASWSSYLEVVDFLCVPCLIQHSGKLEGQLHL
eukprot:m.106042 g.106042  ORF g.106042 m.106042 type:complete len:146 (+) comp37247_c0_seq19:2286-2723(+)